MFFTERKLERPSDTVLRLLQYAGAERVASASRTREPDRAWEALQDAMERPFVAVEVVEDDVPTDYFHDSMTLEDGAALYRPGVFTLLTLGRNRVGSELVHAIRHAIPDSVSDPHRGFSPASPSIGIGWHDIWEDAEHDEGYFFGRAFLSFRLFGYGTPRNWKEYRRLVFDVPAVRALKADLEAIVRGPFEQCIYWSV